ncbi:MAG: glycoside hydrolase family 3 protein, partial [Oscillospiraceae bacterium]|nr:glycoside hydrolase family 3 protein [Oscillospiraceae bacterium]
MDIKEIVKQLTLEEKASLMSGKDFWTTQEIERLDVPSIFLADGPHGVRRQAVAADHLGLNESLKATCFPTAAAVANSWDTALAEELGARLGNEARAQGVSVVLGPGLNIKRSPLCGRNFEYFSEDPYLSGKMAAGYVRGIQSNGISACIKHFAANNQETRRMVSDSIIDGRTLREIYLTAFEIAVKEGGAKAVMTSYNKINGDYTNENTHLLRKILRGEWEFGGAIVTDWGGSNDRVAGLAAGSDLEMPTAGGETDREIIKAVNDGLIGEDILDEAVGRLLTLVFDTYIETHDGEFDKDEHHAFALKAAEESIVLLKNDDAILPLKAGTKVLVAGDFAKNPRYQGAGSSIVNPTRLDTVVDSIGDYGLEVVGYRPGFIRYGKKSAKLIKRAVRKSKKADAVLLFAGLDEITESEGLDRKNINLPQNQLDLIEALYKKGKKVVVILSCGGVVDTSFADKCAAVLHASLGGQAGAGAALNVVCGRVNPSGKLAESYIGDYNDCPISGNYPGLNNTAEYREGVFVGYRYYTSSGVKPRFPFGFGLSYTT